MCSAAFVIIAALAWGGCTGKDGTLGADASGALHPALQGKTVGGDYVQLTDFAGQVVLVNVWATWCGPCRKELPELARLQRDYASQGFTVLGVTVDKHAALPVVKSFIKKHGLRYPMIFDPDGHSVGALSIKGYPTSLLIGRDGALRWRRDGIIKVDDGELGKQLEAALAQAATTP